MSLPQRPFLGWPGWTVLRQALLLGTAQTLWWALVYVGADWLTGLRAERVRAHFDAELACPFVPAFILVYRSIDVMFPLAPFILRTVAEIRSLAFALVCVTAIAGVGFLLVPTKSAFAPQDAGMWQPLFEWNRRIVLTYNMLPSLHVALSVVTLSAYALHGGNLIKVMMITWGAAITLSTMLIHEHHLLDVVSGLLLGYGGYLAYRHWLNQAQSPNIVLANLSSDPARRA